MECSEEQHNEIKEAFELFDDEKSGFIGAKELKVAMRALGIEPKREEINDILADINNSTPLNQAKTISSQEFLTLMSPKIIERDSSQAFYSRYYCCCGCSRVEIGKVSFTQLKRVLKELGEILTDEELQEMIDSEDKDGDGELTEDEFLRIMKRMI